MKAFVKRLLASSVQVRGRSDLFKYIDVVKANMLNLELLGVSQMTWQGRAYPLPSPKVLAILSYLAVLGEAKTRGELLETFWDDGKPANLRFALYKLREVAGAEVWLEITDTFVSVRALTDVHRAERAMRAGRALEALEVWRSGEADKTFLRGFALTGAERFTSWLERERARLDQLYLDTLQGAAEALEGRGALSRALDLAHTLLLQDPLDERAHRAVMRLQHGRGNDEAALAQFETCRLALKKELGAEPLPETLTLLRVIEGAALTPQGLYLLKANDEIPSQPRHLFGRDDLLRDAQKVVQTRGRLLLQGFGGVGKTALAAAFAARYLEGASGAALWVQVGDSGPEVLFDGLGKILGAQHAVNHAEDKPRVIRNYLNAAGVTLVVLDDVGNAYSLGKLLEALPESVPVLITSRHRYSKVPRLEVGRLTREAALELLACHARCALRDDPYADRLCNVLGDHAFALRLAGLVLALDALDPERLLIRLGDAPHTLKVPPNFAGAGYASVSALIATSLEALSEDAHEVFMAIGRLYAPNATPELLALCVRREVEATEGALFELQRRGLAERRATPGQDAVTYELHDLAYSFARANSHHRRRMAENACEAFVGAFRRDFGTLDAERINLLGAAEAFAKQGDDVRFVTMLEHLTVGDAYYQARGHSPGSLGLLRAALSASKRLGKLRTGHFLAARLGDAYRELYGDFEAALGAFEEALELARAYGDAHREVVMLTLLGTTSLQMGVGDAERYLAQAYRLAKRRGDDTALTQVLEHQGCAATTKGHFSAARECFEEGFEVISRLEESLEAGFVLLSQDPDHASASDLIRLRFFMLLNAGEADRGLGDLQLALERRAAALELAQEQQNRLWQAYALHELGETYHDLGDTQRARAACHRALELYRENRVTSALASLSAFIERAGYALPGGTSEDSSRNALQTLTQ